MPPAQLLTLLAIAETLAISVPTVVDGALQRMSIERGDDRLAHWSRKLIELAEIRLTVSGTAHHEEHHPCVVMSNHQSHYDVPVLFQALPGRLRMVAKTELYRIPVFGPALRASGFVEIDRSNRERAIASLAVARQQLREGVSIWIAPEGTRSVTGELGTFKKGGFVLAMETGLPILPVALYGTRDTLPVHTGKVRTGARVHVAIGPAIPAPADATTEARDALMQNVRTAIASLLEECRARVADDP